MVLILKYIENGFVIVHYELQPSKPNKKKKSVWNSHCVFVST